MTYTEQSTRTVLYTYIITEWLLHLIPRRHSIPPSWHHNRGDITGVINIVYGDYVLEYHINRHPFIDPLAIELKGS